MLSRTEKASKYVVYRSFTKIKYLNLIYLFYNYVCNVYLGCTEKQLGIGLCAQSCIFINMYFCSWFWVEAMTCFRQSVSPFGADTYKAIESPFQLPQFECQFFFIHLPFLSLNMLEASPEDGGKIQSGHFQAGMILLHMLGSWSNSWELPVCYRKIGKL